MEALPSDPGLDLEEGETEFKKGMYGLTMIDSPVPARADTYLDLQQILELWPEVGGSVPSGLVLHSPL